jgi:hypothetical protein
MGKWKCFKQEREPRFNPAHRDLTSSHLATGTLLAPVSRLGLGPVPQTSHLRDQISDQGLEA